MFKDKEHYLEFKIFNTLYFPLSSQMEKHIKDFFSSNEILVNKSNTLI